MSTSEQGPTVAVSVVAVSPSQAASEELGRLEAVIARGLGTFVEVGQALLRINEGRLYRALGYSSFGEYAERRWDISRSYAYRQMEAARVVAVLSPFGDTPLPANEAQARELARAGRDPELLRTVWSEAVQASGGKVTASSIRRRIDAHRRWNGGTRLARHTAEETRCPTCGAPWRPPRG